MLNRNEASSPTRTHPHVVFVLSWIKNFVGHCLYKNSALISQGSIVRHSYVMEPLLHIYRSVAGRNEFENWSVFGEVTGKNIVVTSFSTCRAQWPIGFCAAHFNLCVLHYRVLHYLLPAERDSFFTDRLRSAKTFLLLHTRTTRYRNSFLHLCSSILLFMYVCMYECMNCVCVLQALAANYTRYDTRCYFNIRSKANMSQLNLLHGVVR